MKQIKSALISVFYKDGLDSIVRKLDELNVKIYSTGGTLSFIESLGIKAISVESLTGYPSILGGRVKTLHPKVMGGILSRRDNPEDEKQLREYEIPPIDLVIVDLYPFEQTIKNTNNEEEIIEKIDIGGISLIRAGAKNFNDVLVVPSVEHYSELLDILNENKGETSLEIRRRFASYAFAVSSYYDTKIFNYFNKTAQINSFRQAYNNPKVLRYGENPHQKGMFFGNLEDMFEQVNGKEISYNNIGDIDAAINLIDDFSLPTFAIIKHNNACGLACDNDLKQAYLKALEADPISAFGGVFVTNREITLSTAEEMNKLFMEICIAPNYSQEALELLKSKKNRIILKRKNTQTPSTIFRSALNGVLMQEKDNVSEEASSLESVTKRQFTIAEKEDLSFANKIVKHTKSNAIVLAKNLQLLSSGTGQTSRVDALKQAIEKAKNFNFDLHGAVMASDAFFPFSDCVEIACKEGIKSVIQPGGSIKDKDSIDYCQDNDMSMALTGYRHFKH
ncbi:MAG: bifunctional phosphoribosylaminoimidazolecarboxamide formyltransferase/IMP cyclohydrolase [Bacteroidales bacterium]|jgi:phosphoribosylaminoimidazolecarboxamide formyltransferase/IMP cyclohydrolase|nr:bifunctional phosphoribosylaminoimidazolecarboxamide formyltransferase/IMP cyclohydrolase [Bacteroidales bacterium]